MMRAPLIDADYAFALDADDVTRDYFRALLLLMRERDAATRALSLMPYGHAPLICHDAAAAMFSRFIQRIMLDIIDIISRCYAP